MELALNLVSRVGFCWLWCTMVCGAWWKFLDLLADWFWLSLVKLFFYVSLLCDFFSSLFLPTKALLAGEAVALLLPILNS